MTGRPVLELLDLRKTYGGTVALASASLRLAPGTIHGLVGPNGAGKSTLVKIGSGRTTPDAGEIRVGGQSLRFRSPHDALAHGLYSMPQELTVVPGLSVAENIVLGAEPATGPILRPSRRRSEAARVMARMGLAGFPVDTPVDSIAPPLQRLVMLAQALYRRTRVLFLDEPTAALTPSGAENVLEAVRSLRAQGISIVYVSHRFDEVARLCDIVTVIRDGRVVATVERPELSEDALVSAVVGQGQLLAQTQRTTGPGEVAVAISDVWGRDLHGVSIEACTGEILGIAGLSGSGVTELLEVIAGAARPQKGSVIVDGERQSFRSPSDAIKAGIAYLPAERGRAGFLEQSVRFNVTLSVLDRISRRGFTTVVRERDAAREVLAGLGLGDRVDDPLSALSGGNRQKALVARSLLLSSAILVLDDPSLGVDVQARAELHRILGRLADESHCLIVSSSEPEELAALADRVVVLARGLVTAVLSGSELTPERVTGAVTGQKEAAA